MISEIWNCIEAYRATFYRSLLPVDRFTSCGRFERAHDCVWQTQIFLQASMESTSEVSIKM